jgi:hypothetical protein
LTIFSLSTSLAFAAQPATFVQDGQWASGRTYHLEVRESPYTRRANEKEDDGSRWGIDGGFPATFISTFSLVIDGKKIPIPRKLYEDLSSPNIIEILDAGSDVRVHIEGGDGAAGYDVLYVFKIPHEIERTVRMGELPDSVWERTTWHSNPNYEEVPKK